MSRKSYHHPLTPLEDMVAEACAFMIVHEPPEGYTLANSFGKDSVCLVELAKMAGVKATHVHNYTGIDPPELIKFGRMFHPDTKILRPAMTMWEGIHKWFPPTLWQRWCCQVLKETRTPAMTNKFLVGVRAEESPRRAKRGMVNVVGKETRYAPLFHWKEWHVWEFIESLGLPYCELYDEGFDRLGCVVCPMHASKSMGKMRQHRERWPGYYKTFEHAVHHWFYNHSWWDRWKWKTADRFLEAWYKGFK